MFRLRDHEHDYSSRAESTGMRLVELPQSYTSID